MAWNSVDRTQEHITKGLGLQYGNTLSPDVPRITRLSPLLGHQPAGEVLDERPEK